MTPQCSEARRNSADPQGAWPDQVNTDGFDSLYPRYAGGRSPTFTLPQRREIKKLALSRPVDHGLPFSTWSLAKLADFLVAEGVVDDISHEGLRLLLREEGVSFQRLKTWKQSNDPAFEPKKNRAELQRRVRAHTPGPRPGSVLPATIPRIGWRAATQLAGRRPGWPGWE